MKQLERLAKVVFAMVMAVLLWRPKRALPQKKPLRVLVVRIDNRVGEALLSTPLFDALAAAGHEVHLLTHPKMRRVLEGHPSLASIRDWQRSVGVLRGLRAEAFDVVINCGNWAEPAVTSAVVARLCAGRGVVIGPQNFPSRWLMDVAVAPLAGTTSEFMQRAHLGSVVAVIPAAPRLSFRAGKSFESAERYAVVNPGGRLDYRRVKPEVFAQAASALVQLGVKPIVTWGPGEEALADAVCAACPQAVRAPATGIEELSAMMRGAAVTVCNNTGPMHLSVAVGCPTVALFLHMDVERWGHAYAPHRMVDLTHATVDLRAELQAALR